MRGCKRIAEVAAEDGIRMTRTRTALAATTTVSKRRRVDGGELELATNLVQLETQTLSIMTPENSDSGNSTCESFSSDHVLASCCSSNEINEVVKGNSKFSDLQVNV
ncbi:unnamed protein product [Fraxinus pennsylvanica]|uniref:Uncharacterized protein n=1 Tax=Fraxinus pennsylvanica TaxID=56036 RepID=A0AAD1ZDF1_9LAMI|nr:unnamed protein product [Fraxinus pennsylvanica]